DLMHLQWSVLPGGAEAAGIEQAKIGRRGGFQTQPAGPGPKPQVSAVSGAPVGKWFGQVGEGIPKRGTHLVPVRSYEGIRFWIRGCTICGQQGGGGTRGLVIQVAAYDCKNK